MALAMYLIQILECVSPILSKSLLSEEFSDTLSATFLKDTGCPKKMHPRLLKFDTARIYSTYQYLEFLIMISNFDFLIPRLPDIVQKCFCTPDGATYPTFQMRYVSAI